jgi:hypothetical protein
VGPIAFAFEGRIAGRRERELRAGDGRDNDFVTIMATPTVFNGVQLPVFSDPTRACDGHACGVDRLDPTNGADSARAIAITMSQVAAYR